MIFKLQRPTMPRDGQWMFYNRNHKKSGFIPADLVGDDLLKLMGGEFKVYVEAEIDADGKFVISNRVDEQDW